ncbi:MULTISPECIES: hypothetical protein [unclassified Rhodococcus (in: high G+C Gram-positive bacteria)]|uniref:hypothetical protein n=1 Tax=unclassified Rhodococcus (in: high G+C Gram-positive bacteria) TaxID=192944 RepID=UPI0028981B44|nr:MULTISPECIES: hypothetical protein [unclassified Rhodococcus (in: high G+C Gram-positive bacteria)]
MPPAADPADLPARRDAADRLWSGIDPSSPIRRVVEVRPVLGDDEGRVGGEYGEVYGDLGSSIDDFLASIDRAATIDARWYEPFTTRG